MGKIALGKVKELIDSLAINEENRYIKFDMSATETADIREDNGTKYFMLKVFVTAQVKNKNEEVKFTADILKIPHETPTGFIVKGKSKQIVDDYTRSHGWYIMKATKGFPVDHAKVQTERGPSLTVFPKKYELHIGPVKMKNDPTVPLAMFLKAFTGESYSSLASKIGTSSIYVQMSFNVEVEPTRSECISAVYDLFYSNSNKNSSISADTALNPEEKFSKIAYKVIGGNSIYIGDSAELRLARTLSFKSRCKGMYLKKSIQIGPYKFQSDSLLDARDLETLDYLPVDSIVVSSVDNSEFVVNKSSFPNFRALGMKLTKDVSVSSKVFSKGTVLTIEDLKEIGKSSIASIEVENFSGETVLVKRTVFDGTLKIEDLIAITQVYVNSLAGMNLYDDIYSNTNQNLRTLNTMAAAQIKANCQSIINSLFKDAEYYSTSTDLLSRVTVMEPLNCELLMEFVSNPKNRESQQAEINNSLQKLAKDYRMSKNAKRSTDAMRNVQDSQFSRVDSIESPESSKIGMSHSRTFLSKEDANGFILAPLIRVENGVVVDEDPVYLTREEEESEFIAEWNETFHREDENGNKILKERILVRAASTQLEVPIADVRYMQYSPFDDMSPSRMMVTFPQNSQAKRQLMASNQGRQAVTLLKAERPLVGTGGESILNTGYESAKSVLTKFHGEQNIKEPLEEFVKRTLHLVNVTVIKENKLLELEIEGFDGPSVRIEIPAMHKAASGTLYAYEVNNRTQYRYSGNTVITHAVDVDIDEVKMNMYADFGHMKVDKSIFNQSLATARNFLVAYKTHEGSTIDDATVFSDDVLGLDLATSVELVMETYELVQEISDPRARTIEVESFGSTSKIPYMTDAGLPKVGTNLRAGDIVIGVKSELRAVSKSGIGSKMEVTSKNVTLNSRHEGMVVFTKIEGRKATVLLATTHQIEPGDKVAGRHGNKCVVGKIVPRSQMPYIKSTGDIIQVILNPQGVPSRINISQLIEGVAGFAMKKKGEHCIITPFLDNSTELVKKLAEEQDIRPTTLVDGRTGQDFKRPINVVYLYISPLEHKSSHKSKYVGLHSPLDPVFCQPSKGDGGQAIGEMETWALRAAGANKVLDDLMSIQSDDLAGQSVLRRAIAEDPKEINVEGNNNNDLFFQALLRGLGVDPQYDKNGDIVFTPMIDSKIRSLSSIPIDIFSKKSLENNQIFGSSASSMARFEGRKNWGWLPLRCEIIHPFFVVKSKLTSLFIVGKMKDPATQKITWSFPSHNFLWELIATRSYVKELEPGRFLISSSEDEFAITGMTAVSRILRTVSTEDAIAYVEGMLGRSKSQNTILKYKKQLYNLRSFLKSGIKLSDYLITALPIIPLAMRPKAKFERVTQDFDYYYYRIIDEVAKFATSSSPGDKDKFNIFLRIAEFTGLTYGKEVEKNKSYKPLIKYFTGREGPDNKHGRLRESLIKKRQLMSGRTPIIPSRDISRPPQYIGLPFEGVVIVWKTQLAHLLDTSYGELGLDLATWETLLEYIASNRQRFNDMAIDCLFGKSIDEDELYNMMYSLIKDYVEGATDPETGRVKYRKQVVLAGRQPTLHKFNIRAYYVVIVPDKCIEIPPLVCPLYNADFDGDQMWFVALMNNDAMDEAMELMSLSEGIINPKDGTVIMSPSQDMRLGMYFATMLHNNVDHISKDSRYTGDFIPYRSLDTIRNDVDMDIIQLHDLVALHVRGNWYLSTAGRILFNGLLPSNTGFTDEEFTNVLEIPNIENSLFRQLKFEGLVSGNGGKGKIPKRKTKDNKDAPSFYVHLSKVLKYCYENFHPEVTVETLHKFSEFGFRVSDISGISISMEDFAEHPTTQIHINQAKVYAEEINRRYFLGMLSAEERKEELIYLYTQCKEKVKASFMSNFDRNNNLFLMFDSGARGNEDQIIQSSAMVGIMKKTKDETLEVPILNPYIKGLTALDTLQASYSNRVGVSSSQNETADSGALGRLATYMSEGIMITEHDCGTGFHDYKVLLKDFKGMIRLPNGEISDVEVLIGKELGEDERAHKYLKNFLVKGNKLNKKCVEILLKNKIQRINCVDGEYQLLFSIDPMMRSLLFFRQAEGLEHLREGKYITSATIDYIEKQNLETVRLRTLLDCHTTGGGKCQCCYGLMYDKPQLPPIGKAIGTESSECISEPAAQLNLNAFHTGGVAGKSVSRGVELLNSLLQTGFSKKIPRATLASYNGYVNLRKDKTRPLVYTEDGESAQIHFVKDKLLVEDGEYVEKFSPLSVGAVLVAEPMINPTLDEIKRMQMSLLEAQYRVFEANNIDVYARHFELFAMIETSLCDVIESEDPNFEEGGTYEIFDVMNNCQGNYSILVRDSHSSEVMLHYGGALTTLVHEDLASRLGKVVTYGTKATKQSFVGKMAVGRTLSQDIDKVFTSNYVRVKVPEYTEEQESKIIDNLKDLDLVKELEVTQEVIGDIDWGEVFGEPEDLFGTEEETSEAIIGKDETPKTDEKEVSKEEGSVLKSSSAWGN